MNIYIHFQDLYMKNMVTAETLYELQKAGKLTADEVSHIITDRLDKYGY